VTTPFRRKPALLLIFTALAIAAFFLAYPDYVIRPQRRQGAKELQAALFVLQYQHLAELLCAAVALVGLIFYLRSRPERGSRIGAIAAVATALVCAALSRVNIYEFMFHPAGKPSFQPVRETKLDDDQNVLAVNMSENARAYPVRSISYHHIVNDVVGGVPIAVTY
jgi:hypothetical protein